MLMAGEKIIDRPEARVSCPTATPTLCRSSGSQLDASPMPEGKAVAWIADATPRGPSVPIMGGIPSRGTPGICTTPGCSPPKHIRTFSSRVMRFRMPVMRCSVSDLISALTDGTRVEVRRQQEYPIQTPVPMMTAESRRPTLEDHLM